MSVTEMVSIHISRLLHDRLEKRAQETGFSSVEEYVNFVLDEVVKKSDEKFDDPKVKERLHRLGYL